MVIGINDYDNFRKLEGAINDAEDVAGALREQANARTIVLLKDREATRDRVLAAWQQVTASAKPGDLVVVHIAGHGARSPEKVRGTGTGGLDEFTLLSAFDDKGPSTRERIINKEWGALLRTTPHLRVVFVADTCHSGQMTRGYGRTPELGSRLAAPQPIIIRDDALPAPDPATWVVTPGQLAHVAFFGAVGQDELDPEVLIDGKVRGALSWAVARGLRGAADLDRDRVISKDELVRFVRENVTMQTDGQQHPHLSPGSVSLLLAVAQSEPQKSPLIVDPRPLRLAINNTGPVPATTLASGLRNVSLVTDRTPSDLTWNVTQGTLANQFGDTLVFAAAAGQGSGTAQRAATADPEGAGDNGGTRDYVRDRGAASKAASGRDGKADLPHIQSAIDKMHVAAAIKAASASQPLAIRLSPRDTLQHQGDRAALTVTGNKYRFLTLINIGPTGNVNLIYPIQGDPLEMPAGQPYTLDLKADSPYGAEHFLAVTSDKPLATLHRDLESMDGKPRLDELKRALATGLSGSGYEMAVHTVFTAP